MANRHTKKHTTVQVVYSVVCMRYSRHLRPAAVYTIVHALIV